MLCAYRFARQLKKWLIDPASGLGQLGIFFDCVSPNRRIATLIVIGTTTISVSLSILRLFIVISLQFLVVFFIRSKLFRIFPLMRVRASPPVWPSFLNHHKAATSRPPPRDWMVVFRRLIALGPRWQLGFSAFQNRTYHSKQRIPENHL